jgi:hypothetical protein
LVAFENLEEILNLMVMNGSILSTVNDSYIRPEIFQVNCFLYWQTFQKPTASSDTDTTLSLALKQFDAKMIKTIYLRYPMELFSG